MKNTLSNGFKFELDDGAIDDLELAEEIGEGDSGNPGGYIKAMKRLLGLDQYNRLKEHLRDKDSGKVKLTTFGEVLTEIIELATTESERKNS